MSKDVMKRLSRRILGNISIIHAKVFPPKPFIQERWVTTDGVLKETIVKPSVIWPLYGAIAEHRMISGDPERTKQLLETGEYPLFEKAHSNKRRSRKT